MGGCHVAKRHAKDLGESSSSDKKEKKKQRGGGWTTL